MAGLDPTRFKIPSHATTSYSDPRYWHARYTEKGSDPKQDLSFAAFDWYLRFEQLKEILLPILEAAAPPPAATPPAADGEEEGSGEASEAPKSRILVLGCGTSALTEDLHHAGYVNVTSVDSCEPLIEHLAAKHEAKETLSYVACDVKALPEEWNSQFDVVIDKACLDAIAVGRDARQDVPVVLSAVSKVLKPTNGVYVSISHAGPELRQPMLSGTNDLKVTVSKKMRWCVSHHPLPRLLAPPADPNAKGGAAAKGGPVGLQPSTAFRENENVFNMYVCRRPPHLADDCAGWFDFWASPEIVLTRDTLSRSLIKSLYTPEAERTQLRVAVAEVWSDFCGDAESIARENFVAEEGLAKKLLAAAFMSSQVV